MVKYKHSCPLPFNHMAVRPDGKILPCCIFRWDDVPDDLNIFHSDPFNHPYLVSLREKMKNDEYVKGCSQCYSDEEFGGHSFRKYAYRKSDELGTNSFEENLPNKLTYLDLSISNTCNNKCRMCGPRLSTSWYKDAKKLGQDIPKGIIKNPFIENTDFSGLRYLKLLGGEPLMEQDTIKNIIKQCDISKLQVQIITNTTVRPDNELLNLLQSAKKLEVKLSVDSYGTLNDFLRSGSKWSEVEENIYWWQDIVEHKNLSIHSVASIYNVNKIHELVDFSKRINIFQSYVLVDNPNWLLPRHLPTTAKKFIIDTLQDKDYDFKTILIDELQQQGDFSLFQKHDNALNNIRNEHWKDFNPELYALTNS